MLHFFYARGKKIDIEDIAEFLQDSQLGTEKVNNVSIEVLAIGNSKNQPDIHTYLQNFFGSYANNTRNMFAEGTKEANFFIRLQH